VTIVTLMSDTPTPQPSHLARLCRYLLAGGLLALLGSTLLQWGQMSEAWREAAGGGRGFDGFEFALVTQLMYVLGTVALTGAVFGYVLLAARRDREASSREGEAQDADWYE
jgi:hypothetical protein